MTIGTMPRRMRQAIQSSLRRRGIEVRKIPASFATIPVFDLAVQALMSQRGDVLRFVQVGANDGVFVDPLRPYVLSRGWRGILVEPQPDVFERLKANYAQSADKLIFENVAISSQDHLTLYLPPTDLGHRDPAHAYSVVSSDARVIAKSARISESQLRKMDVPAITLDALLARHQITDFDLLQIDAEGYDWDVLQTLDLGKVAPTLIQFETGHLNRRKLTEMAEHLNAAGYLIYYAGFTDALAMRREFFEGL
jgi:FkbM family methyltransferase